METANNIPTQQESEKSKNRCQAKQELAVREIEDILRKYYKYEIVEQAFSLYKNGYRKIGDKENQYKLALEGIKRDAVKEFTKKLKDRIIESNYITDKTMQELVIGFIDEILKEQEDE